MTDITTDNSFITIYQQLLNTSDIDPSLLQNLESDTLTKKFLYGGSFFSKREASIATLTCRIILLLEIGKMA